MAGSYGLTQSPRNLHARLGPGRCFYFTLGRGKPSKPIDTLFYTHCGRILGHFTIERIVRNDGTLPKLRSLQDRVSEWQIKPDRWVAVCAPPFVRLEEKLYYEPFRGWRYFDLEKHRGSLDALIRI